MRIVLIDKMKNKLNIKIIMLLIILTMFPLVSSMQDFTYYVNSTQNFSLIDLNYENDFYDIDPWFRYGDSDLEFCVQGLIGNEENYDLTIKYFYLDCDEFSFYNFIKYIRKNNFEIILGSELDSSEINSANNLASFFNINIIKHDYDYSSITDITENVFIIGNSNQNALSQEVLGDWNYSSDNSIARFIVNESKVKIILAGTNPIDTSIIINSIIEKANYYESFTEDCVVLSGCEYVCYPGDLNCDGVISVIEIFHYLIKQNNQEISDTNFNLAIKKWISQV